VDSDITATSSIQRVMAMAQRWIATPLAKLATAAGIVGTKLALDGYYKAAMIMDWFRAALAYARMAGLTTATGLVSYVKLELLSAGRIMHDLKAMAGTAGKIAVPAMLMALGTTGKLRAEDRVQASTAAHQAMKLVKDRKPPELPPLVDPDKLNPDKITKQAERDQRTVAALQQVANLQRSNQQAAAQALTITHPVYRAAA
jgi:hypothetical protein